MQTKVPILRTDAAADAIGPVDAPNYASWHGGARRVIGALAAFKGHSVHLRFFAYPHASGRLCLVCVERPDGTDVLQVLAELDGPIPVIDDEHAIERQFFAASRRRR